MQFNVTLKNLDSFIRRYHLSETIKGALLFFGFGLLYFLFWVFVEYLFWLPSGVRAIVFWGLIVFECFLFYRFLLIPVLKYFNLKEGLRHEEAARIIGQFFPEVKDKLLIAVELNQQEKSELILASIEQKAIKFNTISFLRAVSFRSNLKYLKYALAPVFIVVLFFLFGVQEKLENSLDRVVNYNHHFSPPLPFTFRIINTDFNTIANTSYKLLVSTEGKEFPERVQIQFDNQVFFMKKRDFNQFEFEFVQPQNNIEFQLMSGQVVSNNYTLNVIAPPQILSQELHLNFPDYTKIEDKTLSTLSPLRVPEGTVVSWQITSTYTDSLALTTATSRNYLKKSTQDVFSYSTQLFSDFEYSLTTSNINLKNYETLSSKISVRPDRAPKIELQKKEGPPPISPLHFYGQMSDDYGISKLLLYYAPIQKPDQSFSVKTIPFDSKTLDFVYTFPDGLNLEPDTSYELFFEVLDNSPFSGPNRTRSASYFYRYKSEQVIMEESLEHQESAFQEVQNRPTAKDTQSHLEAIKKLELKETLSFNDRQNIKDILKRQMEQEAILKRFNEKIMNTLEAEPQSKKEDKMEAALRQRLDEQEKSLEKNMKALEELRDLANKLDKEELLERTESLAKKSLTNKRSIEQMLELAKRYYISQKHKQIQNKLSNLAEEQQKLSESPQEDNTLDKQDKLNEKFKSLAEDLQELRNQNSSLKTPTEIPETQKEESSIALNQQKASEGLQQKAVENNTKNKQTLNAQIQQQQQRAAQKMKQLSQQMSQQMSGGGAQQMQEDIAMLRQILDNLLLFSFEQEDLIGRFKSSAFRSNDFSKNLISQNNLKAHFEHIDDSLFVLSLRQPLISDRINTEIQNVHHNIDQALNLFSDNSNQRAVASQQYALTSANNLSNILSNALDNMEMQMQASPGEGSGEMQLPDIIMTQEALKNQAQKMLDGTPSNSSGDTPSEQKTGQSDKSNTGKPGMESDFSESEENSQALMQLYKNQQQLRNQLSKALQKQGLTPQGKATLDAMQKLEQMIVNQGVTKNSIAKMQALKYQYMKLKKAQEEQGEDQQRTAVSNRKSFTSFYRIESDSLKQQFIIDDILDRQSLPLRQNLQQKVIEYFKPNND